MIKIQLMNFREIEIFRPYDHGALEEALCHEGFPEWQVHEWLAAEMVRVAKRHEEVLALYSMDPGDGICYLLHGVLVVPKCRQQGLGRWLMGHAIGVAESKGARRLRLTNTKNKGFFFASGFAQKGNEALFELIPE